MQRSPLRLLTIASVLGLAAAGAQALPAPPIKPGLWQVHSEREVDGKKAPDPGDRMKNLPPEARKQIEAMMKQKGVDMGQGGVSKICHSRESLDQGRWTGDSERCKTEVTSRSASSWKWHSTCTQPEYEADGEAIFTDSENYIVKNSMTTKRQGQSRNTRMTITAKWLGADCGDLKPFQPFTPGK